MNHTTINNKWVYKFKHGPQKNVLQYKIYWIVKRFQQKENIKTAFLYGLIEKQIYIQ